MEFSQEKGGLFDWEGSEEEPLVRQNSGARGFCHDRDRRLEHQLGHLLGKYNDDNQSSALSIMVDYLALRGKGLAIERVIYVRWDKLENSWYGTFNPDYSMRPNLPETYQLPFYFNAWITRKLP